MRSRSDVSDIVTFRPSQTPNEQTRSPRADLAPSWRELAERKHDGRIGGLSLRGRLLLYFTLLVFSSVGASTWLLTLRGQGVAAQSLADMATAVARSLSTASAVVNRDPAALQSIAESELADGQLLAIEFLDETGRRMAFASKKGIDSSSLEVTGALSPHVVKTSVGDVMLVSQSLASRVAGHTESRGGSVRVATSMRSIGQNTQAMLELIALVGSGVTLTAAMLVSVLLRRSRRPLRELVKSVRAVVAGEIDTIVADVEHDQVSELTGAFNELILGLRTNRAQLAAANEELAAMVRGLEQNIADRTSQLEAANGRLSGEIAEKEDFLRAVSHDLNAPLRNIGGMVSMLMMKNKDDLPAEVVSRLERIRKNVDVETDLINELLELSRIKTRRQKLDRVDTEAIVWELRGMFENDLKTRRIDVIVETSLPPLYAERARVRQIFQNLIDNAIKYMGDGPVREIRIGCAVSVTETAFYVRDTGLGIHPEDLDKVFFVFRRGRGEVSQKVPGKGVGLSSVKSIVETYAGQIRVESTLGSGSTFHFTINGKYVATPAGYVPEGLAGQASDTAPSLANSPASRNAA